MDLSIFTTPEAWISLITLLFLEIVLGVDNLVFIAITTDRLPPEKQHIGRKLGLLGAMLMRILFLSFASFLVHMTNPLFTIPGVYIGGEELGFSIRDLVLLFGGLYLIYKGIVEVRDVLRLSDEKESQGDADAPRRALSLPGAVGTIMVMDLVFSIDSVITAVGLANHLIVMVLAVMIAIILMMVFIDAISDFINAHTEMKILALVFIVTIGVLLVLDSLGINSGIEVLDMHAEKLMVYFAMVFAIVLEVIQMRYTKNYREWTVKKNLEMMRARGYDPQKTDTLALAEALMEVEESHPEMPKAKAADGSSIGEGTPAKGETATGAASSDGKDAAQSDAKGAAPSDDKDAQAERV